MVSLTLYFRHVLTYSRLIHPYLFLLRHILIKNILLQPYSGILSTPHIVFRQIQCYLEPQLIESRYVSGIFSHIHNVRHIEECLATFKYIWKDSCIFKILAQLAIFMYIKAYSERMTYTVIFRTVDIFSQFHTLLKEQFMHILNLFWADSDIYRTLAYLGA